LEIRNNRNFRKGSPVTRQWLSGARLAAVALGLSVIPSVHATAQEPARASLQGSWTGDFGAGQWTFKFVRVNGAWSGTYTYPQYKGWNPVINLSASDRAAKFSLQAKSSVDFDLKLDSSRNNLSGTVRFGHGVTASSPPVVVPVALKRVP
jgi:hypothetical protein